MSRAVVLCALLALAGLAVAQNIPSTFSATYTLFDTKGVKLEFGTWYHDDDSQRDRFDLVAAVDGSRLSRWNFYKEETQFELNSTECATNELRVLYMDPFEWVRIADDQGNGTTDDNAPCEKYSYSDDAGNVLFSGCFSENVDSETGEISLAPRIVLDAKADRVWHFQTFEALATVPEEQFLVPEICTEDPEPEPLPAF